MKNILKLAASVLIASASALAFAGQASASLHVDGTPSCLAADGSYSVTWSVVFPVADWTAGRTITPKSTVIFTPSSIMAGQVATGVGTGYTGATASLEVVSTLTGGNFELATEITETATVNKPTVRCQEQETTTTTPVDLCPNIEGNQASIPAGLELSGGRCLTIVTTTTTVASAAPTTTAPPSVGAEAVVPTTAPAATPTELPATGLSMTQAAIALMLMSLGGVALVASRRYGSAEG
jgi:hypothetical protein